MAGDVHLVRYQDQTRAIGDTVLEGGRDLIKVLWWNRNLDQFQFQSFAAFTLAQRREHAWVILRSAENFVAGFEIHSHQENFQRLGGVAGDSDFFAVATEQFSESGANRLRLRLENLPHRVRSRIFLLPDVTDQRFRDQPRAGRHSAIVEIDDAARDSERVLNDGPVIFIHRRLFRRQMGNTFARSHNFAEQGSDRR